MYCSHVRSFIRRTTRTLVLILYHKQLFWHLHRIFFLLWLFFFLVFASFHFFTWHCQSTLKVSYYQSCVVRRHVQINTVSPFKHQVVLFSSSKTDLIENCYSVKQRSQYHLSYLVILCFILSMPAQLPQKFIQALYMTYHRVWRFSSIHMWMFFRTIVIGNTWMNLYRGAPSMHFWLRAKWAHIGWSQLIITSFPDYITCQQTTLRLGVLGMTISRAHLSPWWVTIWVPYLYYLA